MEKWYIALVAISAYLVLAFIIGIMAGRGRSFFSLSEYAVGDRSFNLFIMWFLMGGTIFSAFAFLGGPGCGQQKPCFVDKEGFGCKATGYCSPYLNDRPLCG